MILKAFSIRSIRLTLCTVVLVVIGSKNPIAVGQETRSGTESPLLDRKVEITERELAELVGPRALSRAFRYAAKRASPGVVTVLCYGQGQPSKKPEPESEQDSNSPEIPGPPLPKLEPGMDPDAVVPNDEEAADEDSEPSESEADPEVGPAPPASDPDDPSLVLSGLGSGVIVDPTGLVLTNQHVVRGAKRVVVQMPDETEYVAVKVEGDPDSDVAILRIESSMPLPSVEVGNSDKLDIGDWVLAIGSPFRLDATVSAGIISALDRKLNRIQRGRMLQTDAAINPGNSGGPMIDLDGKVVGINTAIASRNGGNQGIGFAIPINSVVWIARELDQHGKVRRAAMGIRLAELKPKLAKRLGYEAFSGVLVGDVISDSAAERADIERGDVILKFAGVTTRRAAELQEVVERMPIGSTQKVLVKREGEEIELEIELAPLDDVTK